MTLVPTYTSREFSDDDFQRHLEANTTLQISAWQCVKSVPKPKLALGNLFSFVSLVSERRHDLLQGVYDDTDTLPLSVTILEMQRFEGRAVDTEYIAYMRDMNSRVDTVVNALFILATEINTGVLHPYTDNPVVLAAR